MFDDSTLPGDPFMLLSYINTKLRDQYTGGLDQLCDDLNVDRADLEQRLHAAGFEYDPTLNRFA